MGRTNITLSTLPFVADQASLSLNTGRQIDWNYVRRDDAVVVTAAANAAQGATAITVDALSGPIPSGTLLQFGADEYATLTADADEGDTSLAVSALVNAIEDNDTALYGGTGVKKLDAGTVMVQLTNGKMAPRASRPGAETAIGLLASHAYENSKVAALSGYGVIIGGVMYQNLLPEGTPDSTVKSELNTAGTGFAWQTYEDSIGE